MKLWEVTIERSLFVLAENARDAESIGVRNEREESYNSADFVNAIEITDLKRIPKEWRDSLPYSKKLDGEINLTCEEFLTAK